MKPFKEIKKQLLKEIEKLKDKKGFIKAGLPRYDWLFGRDALIVAWQLLKINPEICQKTLEILAKFQGKKIDNQKEEEPGKILHTIDFKKKWHPSGRYPFPYYGSFDSTPLFLIVFSFYFKQTKNKKFLEAHWRNILSALNWIKKYGDKNNDLFLEYQRKNPTGIYHQGWKNGLAGDYLEIKPPIAMVEIQGYQYLALIEMANLSFKFAEIKLQKELLERAKNLKKNFNKKFWMPNKKYFAFFLDGEGKQKKVITSNPGHLLFTGIVEKDKEKFVVKRLFDSDLFTPFGIRVHSEKEKDFDPTGYCLGSVWPHDNWIIAQGLKKLGYQREYQKIKKAILRAYKEIGYLPEYYGVSLDKKLILKELTISPCYPQAWSSGALLNFLTT